MSTRAYITLKRKHEYRTIWVHWDGLNHGDTLVRMTPSELESLWDRIGEHQGHIFLDHLYTTEAYDERVNSPVGKYLEKSSPMGWFYEKNTDYTASCIDRMSRLPTNPDKFLNRREGVTIYDYALSYIFDLTRRSLYVSCLGRNYRKVPAEYMEHPSEFYEPIYDRI